MKTFWFFFGDESAFKENSLAAHFRGRSVFICELHKLHYGLLKHCGVCSVAMGRRQDCRGTGRETKASFMALAACVLGWLTSLGTPEGSPLDLQKLSPAGSVGKLLVWTACIPYASPVSGPHRNPASTTATAEQPTHRLAAASVSRNQERLT